MLKKEKGITLIALVITIIVLLILAAVSIATLTGENGILTKAGTAKTDTQKASAIEQAKIDILAWQTKQMQNKQSAELSDDIIKGILTGKDYVKDGEPGPSSFTTKEGDHIIEYSELYTKPTGSQGKTIAELYDGIDNPEDEGYDENAMHIGDWVNYTAGSWGEDEGVATPTTNFTFGGYNDGQSRDENANGTYTGARAGATYEGWRIWDISDDKQTITLISAGCPEEYYHPYGTNYAYISEYILSGNINANANKDALGLETTYTKRDWSIYKNETQYANSARALTKGDLDTWYAKYINNSIDDTFGVSFPANNANKLISTVENQCYYWLSSTYYGANVYRVNPDSRSVHGDFGIAYGVRVLVSLTSEVKFEETPEEIEKDGFTYNKWIIESK